MKSKNGKATFSNAVANAMARTPYYPSQKNNAVSKQIESLQAEVERLKDEYAEVCLLVSQMHRAAMDQDIGPKRGVVEDIVDLRLERDQLRAELEQLRKAHGEPVAWIEHEWSGTGTRNLHFSRREPSVRDEVVNPIWTPLFTYPTTEPVKAQAGEPSTATSVELDPASYRKLMERATAPTTERRETLLDAHARQVEAEEEGERREIPEDVRKVMEQALDVIVKCLVYQDACTCDGYAEHTIHLPSGKAMDWTEMRKTITALRKALGEQGA